MRLVLPQRPVATAAFVDAPIVSAVISSTPLLPPAQANGKTGVVVLSPLLLSMAVTRTCCCGVLTYFQSTAITAGTNRATASKAIHLLAMLWPNCCTCRHTAAQVQHSQFFSFSEVAAAVVDCCLDTRWLRLQLCE